MPVRSPGRRGGLDREGRRSQRSHEGKVASDPLVVAKTVENLDGDGDVAICLTAGWCDGTVHRRSKRAHADPGGAPGARGEGGRGENRRRHTFMDSGANGARSRREEASESRREGRCHQTRKCRARMIEHGGRNLDSVIGAIGFGSDTERVHL